MSSVLQSAYKQFHSTETALLKVHNDVILNIISEVKYGFRKKYSTYMALINLIDKISSGTDSNSFNIGIFTDLFKPSTL